jgi:hypothetical protein
LFSSLSFAQGARAAAPGAMERTPDNLHAPEASTSGGGSYDGLSFMSVRRAREKGQALVPS